jgi:hypothetical protein
MEDGASFRRGLPVRSCTTREERLLPACGHVLRDVAIAEPSFIVVNPSNGDARYVYLLRGWLCVDGAAPADLAAVRYFAAIERNVTSAVRGGSTSIALGADTRLLLVRRLFST